MSFGFKYVICGRRNIDITEPNHGIIGGTAFVTKFGKSIEPCEFVIPFVNADFGAVRDVGVDYFHPLINALDDPGIFGHVGVTKSSFDIFYFAFA